MSTSPICERLPDNLARVRAAIAAACQRSGRSPAGVRLVAVTKYAGLDAVRALIEAGVRDLGESRVQQLGQRAAELGSDRAGLSAPPSAGASPRWHMIGHLQRNKVKTLLADCRVLHSLDSVRLAEEIERQAERLETTVDALVEVNVAGEHSKSGASMEQVSALIELVTKCRHIRLAGLMTMAPYVPDPEATRPHFARLREMLERVQASGAAGPDCRELSMGMSNDYAVAVEEGATIVRVGSALFEGID